MMKQKLLSMLALLLVAATGAWAQSYNVTVKEGTDDATKWSATPNPATEGQTVTIKYTGTKHVKSIKAVKKAAAVTAYTLAESTVGMIVGSDGKAYAVADKDNLPSGVTAVAMVAYKSGSKGLAIQLNDSPVDKNWDDAKTYAEGLTAVPGGTWRLPSKKDWQTMFVGCAVEGDASADDTMEPIAGFRDKIAATGITWLSCSYWSSTEIYSHACYVSVNLYDDWANASFSDNDASTEMSVLGCLAF